jgi:hypothetical protein
VALIYIILVVTMNNNILKFSRLISGNTRILIPGNTRMFTTSSLLTSTVPALLP